MKTDIKSLTITELAADFQKQGYPSYRALQVYGWIHKKAASDWEEMTNLPAAMRVWLRDHYELPVCEKLDCLISADGSTAKYLFRFPDGAVLESVLMKYRHGNSVCISSQVGCRMGCRFCASTLGGLERSLSASEMLEQVYRIQALTGERVSNVVVMGTGEPLDNLEQLLRFIKLLTDENGLNISARNITVSTCGIVEQMKELADQKLQITLAVSLHAPEDELRKSLMPVAAKYRLSEVMDACRYYFNQTGRRVTFEYSLIQGKNDDLKFARMLASLVKGMNCHVNLIPVNPIEEREYRHSEESVILKFKNILENNRINVTIRREMGADIQAACGQLRKKYIDGRKNTEDRGGV